MVLVDLRNHGKPAEIAGLSLPHSIGSAARDLADLVNARGWDLPAVVIVHSMGCKMALDLAESCGCGDYAEHVRFPKQDWLAKLKHHAVQSSCKPWVHESLFCKCKPLESSSYFLVSLHKDNQTESEESDEDDGDADGSGHDSGGDDNPPPSLRPGSDEGKEDLGAPGRLGNTSRGGDDVDSTELEEAVGVGVNAVVRFADESMVGDNVTRNKGTEENLTMEIADCFNESGIL